MCVHTGGKIIRQEYAALFASVAQLVERRFLESMVSVRVRPEALKMENE